MSSRKSTLNVARDNALAPKRERGRRRVEAILDAAAALFAEKGHGATTMTEVAARSHTAIGSLYRFFPTKKALSEALSRRYGEALGERLAALETSAADMAAAGLADALVDLMLDRRRQRAAMVVLLEETDDADLHRAALRAQFTRGLVQILRAARQPRSPDRAEPAAHVVLQMLKGVRRLCDEVGDDHPAMAELRRALALYLADVLD